MALLADPSSSLQAFAQSIVETVRHPLLVIDGQLRGVALILRS
jgi:hypothetical protein